MDKDNGGTIDKEEAVAHFSKSFGKISAEEFFASVDENGDGEIEYKEFINFWQIVKASGHTDEEIEEELDRISKGESWAGFNDLPKRYMNNAIDR